MLLIRSPSTAASRSRLLTRLLRRLLGTAEPTERSQLDGRNRQNEALVGVELLGRSHRAQSSYELAERSYQNGTKPQDDRPEIWQNEATETIGLRFGRTKPNGGAAPTFRALGYGGLIDS